MQVVGLGQRRVVVVAQAVGSASRFGSDVPLVLRETDVVLLRDVSRAGGAVVERARRADVAEVLNRRRLLARNAVTFANV